MKILIVKTVPGEIKVTNLSYNIQEIGIARALRKKGYIIDVMCCSDDNTYKEINIPIGDGSFLKLYCVKSLKIFKNGFPQSVDLIFNQYDLLQVSEYNQLYTWHLAKKYKEKVIVWHGPYYHTFNKRYNLMCLFFDFFFLNRYKKLKTQFLTKSTLATDFLKNKGLTKVTTIGVGIDTSSLISNTLETQPFAELIKQKSKGIKLLYIGRIENRRNPFFLLNILSYLKQQNIEATLILIGLGEKNYVEQFWNYANKLGVKNSILYQERMEQKFLSQIYSQCDIFLLPTFYDIFGMVLLEGMFFQKIILTTINGGSKTLIINEENGFVFSDFDVKKWSKCIETIIQNQNLRKKIEINAHQTITDFYTWDALAEKFILSYKNLLNINSFHNL